MDTKAMIKEAALISRSGVFMKHLITVLPGTGRAERYW